MGHVDLLIQALKEYSSDHKALTDITHTISLFLTNQAFKLLELMSEMKWFHGKVDKCDIFRTRPVAMIYWVIAKTNSVSKLPFVNVLLFYFILVHG